MLLEEGLALLWMLSSRYGPVLKWELMLSWECWHLVLLLLLLDQLVMTTALVVVVVVVAGPESMEVMIQSLVACLVMCCILERPQLDVVAVVVLGGSLVHRSAEEVSHC